jgi:putative FmdB family regulatory protein
MPIYEYVCTACAHRTDILHGIHEDGPAFCPSCGAEQTMKKAFTIPAVVFKGTGWAKKERRSAPTRSGSSGDGAEGAPSDKDGKAGKDGKDGKDRSAARTAGGSGDAGASSSPTASAGSDSSGPTPSAKGDSGGGAD